MQAKLYEALQKTLKEFEKENTTEKRKIPRVSYPTKPICNQLRHQSAEPRG